jgi:hypothetical protein
MRDEKGIKALSKLFVMATIQKGLLNVNQAELLQHH